MSAFVFLNFVRVRAVLDKNAEYIRTIFFSSVVQKVIVARQYVAVTL